MATAVKSGLHHTHTEGLGQTDQDSILLFLWSWHSSCKLLLLCSSQGWWCDCDSSNTYRILICSKAQDLYWSVSHLVLVIVCLNPPPPLTLHLPYIHITLCDWLWHLTQWYHHKVGWQFSPGTDTYTVYCVRVKLLRQTGFHVANIAGNSRTIKMIDLWRSFIEF